jgi:hypothetical protein
MSKRQTNKLRDSDSVGLKYFDRLMPLLERLHGVGAGRGRAGNRQLFFGHYRASTLLFLFNPIVTSPGIQQAGELKRVQKKFGCPRASLGSLSEAVEVFDPQPVKQIAGERAAQREPLANDRRFPEVKHLVTAVDGTVVKTLARIVQAAYLRSPTDGRSLSAWPLHTHFDVERGLPVRIDVAGAGTQGENDERAVLRKTLEPERCYVMDRGYAQFSLFNAVAAIGSSYVCRVRDNSVYEVVGQRPLSAEAAAAGVTCDAAARLGRDRPAPGRPDHGLRWIFIPITPHDKRGKAGGGTRGAARRRRPAPRCEPARRAGRSDRLHLPAAVDDRDLLPLPQAHFGLPAFVEYRSGGRGDSGVLRPHRLSAHRLVDRQAADQADLREERLFLHRLGR